MMGPPLSFGAPMLGIAIHPGCCATAHCKKDFTRQSNLADHIQKKHGMYFYLLL